MVPMEIKRLIYNDLQREMAEPQILVLVGPRQVGKTTLLRRLEADARQAGKRVRFLDLEQPADLATLRGSTADIAEALTNGVDVIFIDEFYYLEDAGKVFKAIYDRGRARALAVKIVLSGSSSVEVHGHLQESLAGRTITYRIFPLSWDEYRGWESERRPSMEDFLRFGGLPGLAHTTDTNRKQRLLQEYVATYIFKDVKGLIREENVRAFNQLLLVLAQNQGQLVESSSLARELGVSPAAVSAYLEVLHQTYVNFSLPSYHTNLANELKKSRKTYLYDLGIRNSLLKDFRPAHERDDKGAIMESQVFLALRPHLAPNMELRFWRTKKREEVDFVLVKDRRPFPIEVKAAPTSGTLSPGIAAFLRRYSDVTATFTVSAERLPSRRDGALTHHFLAFEDASRIVDLVGKS